MSDSQAKKSFSGWAITIACLLIVILILAGLKYRQISKAIAFGESLPERSESVTAIRVEPVNLPIRFKTVGEVQTTQYAPLRNEQDGVIVSIGFSGGDRVEEGQVLLEIDSSQEQAELKATRAQLALAELQLKRALELKKKNLISKNDVDIARADKDVLIANEAALEATIRKKTLLAPFTAMTEVHNLQIGQYIPPNTLITELSGADGAYWIDFELPQEKAVLRPGASIQVSHPDMLRDGQLAEVVKADTRISLESRSLGYRASLSDSSGVLRPGAILNIEAVLDEMEGVYALPLVAVRKNNFGAFVYVIVPAEEGADAAYRAERRAVTARPYDDKTVVVESGLVGGELIAAIGAFKLQDKMLVNIVERLRDLDNGYGESIRPVVTADESVTPHESAQDSVLEGDPI